MSRDDDIERWTVLVAATARGRRLDDAEREFREALERERPELTAEVALWRALGRRGRADTGDRTRTLGDDELCARVLAQARDAAARRRRRVRGAAVAAAACLAVALGLYALLGPRAMDRPHEARAPASAAPMSGSTSAEGHVVWARPGTRTRIAPTTCASVTDDLEVCARTDAAIAVERVDDEISLSLDAGVVDVFGADESRPLRVATPAGSITASGAVFTVTPTPAGPLIERHAGEVELRRAGAEVEAAPPAAGPTSARPAPAREIRAPRDPADAPEKLLERAQQRLGVGDARGAIATYEALLRGHPRSVEARAALVSLGNLLLLRGQDARALQYYERYLDIGGELAEEASYGKINALHRLGRGGEVRSAGAQFLARYPDSLYAPRVRKWATAPRE